MLKANIRSFVEKVKVATGDTEEQEKISLSHPSSMRAEAFDFFHDQSKGNAARTDESIAAELKGSIGEGPNHSNFSDQSSVSIGSKFNNIC